MIPNNNSCSGCIRLTTITIVIPAIVMRAAVDVRKDHYRNNHHPSDRTTIHRNMRLI